MAIHNQREVSLIVELAATYFTFGIENIAKMVSVTYTADNHRTYPSFFFLQFIYILSDVYQTTAPYVMMGLITALTIQKLILMPILLNDFML